MKIWLKPDSVDIIGVTSGDYHRTFSRAEEPFEVTEEEWLRILANTGKLTMEKPIDKRPPKSTHDMKQATTSPRAAPKGSSKAKEG